MTERQLLSVILSSHTTGGAVRRPAVQRTDISHIFLFIFSRLGQSWHSLSLDRPRAILRIPYTILKLKSVLCSALCSVPIAGLLRYYGVC